MNKKHSFLFPDVSNRTAVSQIDTYDDQPVVCCAIEWERQRGGRRRIECNPSTMHSTNSLHNVKRYNGPWLILAHSGYLRTQVPDLVLRNRKLLLMTLATTYDKFWTWFSPSRRGEWPTTSSSEKKQKSGKMFWNLEERTDTHTWWLYQTIVRELYLCQGRIYGESNRSNWPYQ